MEGLTVYTSYCGDRRGLTDCGCSGGGGRCGSRPGQGRSGEVWYCVDGGSSGSGKCKVET